jgi:hypothetical protein
MIKPRRIKWVGHVVCKVYNIYAYEISEGRPEGKTPLGKLRRRWKYNKTDLRIRSSILTLLGSGHKKPA